MSRQKSYEEKLDNIFEHIEKEKEKDKNKIWEELSGIIFKRDQSGEIELNHRKKPRVNWLKILFQIGRVIALIDAYISIDRD